MHSWAFDEAALATTYLAPADLHRYFNICLRTLLKILAEDMKV